MKINIKYLILVIIIISIFFRLYKIEEWSGFDFDQEVAAVAVKSIVVDKKPTLIGQEISVGGIYVGPLYYYILAPFYLLFKMDPIAANALTTIISLFTILSIYYVAKKIFSPPIGTLSSVIYTFGFTTIFHDRNSVPSNPMMVISVWLFYAMYKFFSGQEKFLIPIFAIFGLIFHFHPSALPLIFVFLIMLFLKRVKIKPLTFFIGLFIFILLISPLILFDLRHNFLVTKNLLSFFSSGNNGSISLYKFTSIITINIRNFASLFIPSSGKYIPHFNLLLLPVLLFIFFKKALKNTMNLLVTLWIAVPIIIFTFYKGQVPEYYFMTSTPILIFLIALIWLKIYQFKKYKNLALIIFLVFLVINIKTFFSYKYLTSLKFKKEAVSFIINDSQNQPFNVYIETNLGFSNGFKYLFDYYKKTPQDGPYNLYIINAPVSERGDVDFAKARKNYPGKTIDTFKFADIQVIRVLK